VLCGIWDLGSLKSFKISLLAVEKLVAVPARTERVVVRNFKTRVAKTTSVLMWVFFYCLSVFSPLPTTMKRPIFVQ